MRATGEGVKDGEHSQAGPLKYRLKDPGNQLLNTSDGDGVNRDSIYLLGLEKCVLCRSLFPRRFLKGTVSSQTRQLASLSLHLEDIESHPSLWPAPIDRRSGRVQRPSLGRGCW